jgi:hypothetical protein
MAEDSDAVYQMHASRLCIEAGRREALPGTSSGRITALSETEPNRIATSFHFPIYRLFVQVIECANTAAAVLFGSNSVIQFGSTIQILPIRSLIGNTILSRATEIS